MITAHFTRPSKTPILTVDTPQYTVYRGALHNPSYRNLMFELKPHLRPNSSRESCLMATPKNNGHVTYYSSFHKYDWSPQIAAIRDQTTEMIRSENKDVKPFDFALVHHYRDQKAYISWHSDREARHSPIYIVNIGGVRRFCLRPKSNPKDVRTFDLRNGDILCMKPGCQETFEHCIKPVAKFSDPRISITLRHIDVPKTDFTLNRATGTCTLTPSSLKLEPNIVANAYPLDTRLFAEGPESRVFISRERPPTITSPLLKSNIQKAIRRGSTDIAIHTMLHMIHNGFATDLLRRLTIIAFEDVGFHMSGYCTLMWYYIAISSSSYELQVRDVQWIVNWIREVCASRRYRVSAIQSFPHEKDSDIPPNATKMVENTLHLGVCEFAVKARMVYGGFDGEIQLLNFLAQCVHKVESQLKKGVPLVAINNSNELDIQWDEVPYTLEICPAAIDFHCFPGMPARISQYMSEPVLTEDEVKQYIWNFDSKINIRVSNADHGGLNKKVWERQVKPQCDQFRKYIQEKVIKNA